MTLSTRLLIVDDDPLFTDPLAGFLADVGHGVTSRVDCQALFEESLEADLVVLGCPRERVGPVELVTALRGRCNVAVIVVGWASTLSDRVHVLEAGADDFVVKPLSPRELNARIVSVLRRTSRRPVRPVLRFAGWSLDTETRLLTASNGLVVPLPEGAFVRLKHLLQNPRDAEAREELMHHLDAEASRQPAGSDGGAPVRAGRALRGVGSFLARCEQTGA